MKIINVEPRSIKNELNYIQSNFKYISICFIPASKNIFPLVLNQNLYKITEILKYYHLKVVIYAND